MKKYLAEPVLWLFSLFLNHLVSVLLVLVVSGWSDLSRNLHQQEPIKGTARPDGICISQLLQERPEQPAFRSFHHSVNLARLPPPPPPLRRASHRSPIRVNALAFGLDGVRTVHVLS